MKCKVRNEKACGRERILQQSFAQTKWANLEVSDGGEKEWLKTRGIAAGAVPLNHQLRLNIYGEQIKQIDRKKLKTEHWGHVAGSNYDVRSEFEMRIPTLKMNIKKSFPNSDIKIDYVIVAYANFLTRTVIAAMANK